MKTKTILHFLKKYLLLLCFVMLIMLCIYIQSYKILKHYEYNAYHHIIKSGLDNITEQLSSIVDLSVITYQDSRYQQLFCNSENLEKIPVSNYVLLNQVQKNFNSLFATIPLVKDSGIIFNQDIVLTKQRSIINNKINFYPYFFQYENKSFDEFLDIISHSSSRKTLSMGSISSMDYGTYPGLLFTCGWPSDHINTFDRFLFACFDEKELIATVLPEELLHKCNLKLTESSGEPIYLETSLPESKIDRYLSYHTKFIAISVGIPKNLITSHLKPIKIAFFLIILLMVICFLILALLLSISNSVPLLKLLGLMNQMPLQNMSYKDHSHKKAKNEYDLITDCFNSMYQENLNYVTLISEQKNNLKYHIFFRSIMYGIYSQSQEEEFLSYFPTSNGFYLCCLHAEPMSAILTSTQSEISINSQLQLELLSLLEQALSSDYYRQMIDNENILILIPASINSPAFMTEKINTLKQSLSQKWEVKITLYISNQCLAPKELSLAYAKIRNLILTTDIHSEYNQQSISVINYNKEPSSIALDIMDFEKMSQFNHYLQAGMKDSALSILKQYFERIEACEYIDETTMKQIYYNYRFLLLQSKLTYAEEMLDLIIPQYNPQWKVQKVYTTIHDCSAAICDRIFIKKQGIQNKFFIDVCNYIQENKQNQELYGKMVASHFNISESTLQKIIYQATGTSFYKYLETLRMESAHNLLLQTDESIADICTACGYSSVNAFYKAFKRYYSVTPGAIRNPK